MTDMRMLKSDDVEQAAQHLLTLRANGQPGQRMPPECRPATVADGWRVQQRVSKLLQSRQNENVAGWKCALPSPQEPGKQVLAPIYQSTVHHTPNAGPIAVPKKKLQFEFELAFLLAHDLAPRSTPWLPADIDAAIGRTRLALELIGGRYINPANLDFSELLADGLFNDGLVLGPTVCGLPTAPQFTLEMTVQSKETESVTTHHAVRHGDGNPRLALYWLAEHLRQHGLGLYAEQVVITGALAGVMNVRLPDSAPVQLRFELSGFPSHDQSHAWILEFQQVPNS